MNEKDKKKAFSRIGWYLILLSVTSSAAQILIQDIIGIIYKPALEITFVKMVIIFGSMYLIGVPTANIILKGKMVLEADKNKLSAKTFLKLIPVTIFTVYIGSLIGQVITNIITAITGVVPFDPVSRLITGSNVFVTFIFAGLIGPIVEEYVFRKQIISHTRMFGDKRAIVFSAFVFALFHGNLSQMFYAFTLGLLFGYIYVKTGSIKYSAALHVMVNTVSGVIVGSIASNLDLEVLNLGFDAVLSSGEFWKYLIIVIYSLATMVFAIMGAFIVLKNRRNISVEQPVFELEKPFKEMYLNSGIILFTLNMVVVVISTFLRG